MLEGTINIAATVDIVPPLLGSHLNSSIIALVLADDIIALSSRIAAHQSRNQLKIQGILHPVINLLKAYLRCAAHQLAHHINLQRIRLAAVKQAHPASLPQLFNAA